ncbi:hypothetical protein BGZ63DRAFT_391344 [Mariannaea sp. PMI_226]|nr:hypothetical protein BGZ63DRAFT_391344 [Mariannaea sp. PMI_226]
MLFPFPPSPRLRKRRRKKVTVAFLHNAEKDLLCEGIGPKLKGPGPCKVGVVRLVLVNRSCARQGKGGFCGRLFCSSRRAVQTYCTLYSGTVRESLEREWERERESVCMCVCHYFQKTRSPPYLAFTCMISYALARHVCARTGLGEVQSRR